MPIPPSATLHKQILETADRLFYGEGIQAVGVDRIAAEAGVSKRTLYKHFPSKNLLVAAYLQGRVQAASGGKRPVTDDPVAQILSVFDVFEKWFSSRRFQGCPFSKAITELGTAQDNPAVAVALGMKTERLAWFETKLLQHGLAPEPASELAIQLAIMVEGAVATSWIRGGDPGVARAAKAAAAVLLAAASVAGTNRQRP